jgi:hypothetical protein
MGTEIQIGPTGRTMLPLTVVSSGANVRESVGSGVGPGISPEISSGR